MFVNPNTAGAQTNVLMAVCECCRRLENDTGLKPVQWCGLCQAWLCDRCRGDLMRRVHAALTGR
jgi:hypothetical protein